jgi:hypothetical protein
MSAKKPAFVLLVGLLAVAEFLVMREMRAVNAKRREFAASELQRGELMGEVRRVQSALAQLRDDAALRKTLRDESEGPAHKPVTAIETPAARRALSSWANLYYAQLFKKLGLTAGQIKTMEELAVEHQLRLHDILGAAQAEGVLRGDPSIQNLLMEEHSEFQSAESAVVGVAEMQEVENYERTSMPRALVSQIASSVYDTEPLTAYQGDQLVQLLAANSANFRQGNEFDPDDTDWGQVVGQAQSILSPRQLAMLKTIEMPLETSRDLNGKAENVSISLTSPGIRQTTSMQPTVH